MFWDSTITTAQHLGFDRACIVARETFEPIALGGPQDAPSAYTLGELTIDERQELQHVWHDKNRKVFRFFNETYDIVARDKCIVATHGSKVLIAQQFLYLWFVVATTLPSAQFKNPAQALKRIQLDLWDDLIESGV